MAHIMSWFVPLGTRILNKHKGSWFGGFGGGGGAWVFGWLFLWVFIEITFHFPHTFIFRNPADKAFFQ